MTKVAPVSVARLRASPGYAWHLLASSAPPREASPLPRVLELATSHTASDFPALRTSRNDNNAGIFAMGIPAAISVGYFVWLVTNFS